MNIQNVEWCSPEYQQALDLRHRVLRKPLGLSFSGEDLDAEHGDKHFVAAEGDTVVGVLIARPMDAGACKLRQMAVDTDHQQQGIGKSLVRFVESELKSQGIASVTLHARDEASAFYEKLGYTCVGEPFEEVGIPHVKMQKQLS